MTAKGDTSGWLLNCPKCESLGAAYPHSFCCPKDGWFAYIRSDQCGPLVDRDRRYAVYVNRVIVKAFKTSDPAYRLAQRLVNGATVDSHVVIWSWDAIYWERWVDVAMPQTDSIKLAERRRKTEWQRG